MANEISVIELSERLNVRKGAQMVTMIARTIPDLKGGKKSPLAGRLVEKQSRVNGVVNWSYENAVNNQRCREEKTLLDPHGQIEHFISEPRRWGKRCHGSAFVRHIPTGKEEKRVYVEFKHQNSLGTQYFIDGLPVDKDEVEPHLRDKDESSRQGVDKKIILRDYRISSIEYITFGGETLALKVTPEDESALYDELQNDELIV